MLKLHELQISCGFFSKKGLSHDADWMKGLTCETFINKWRKISLYRTKMKESLRFTIEQKQAAIYALYQISKSDSDLAESEIEFLSRVCELLGEVFDHLSISKFLVKNSPVHLHALMTYNSAQKEWFVIAAYAMLNCDSKLFDEEFTVAQGFFNVMNIDKDNAQKMIAKLQPEVKAF